MSLIKRGDVFTDMPMLFNDLLTRDLWNWRHDNSSSTNTSIPAVNIKEDAENFTVEVAAPGMKKDDFKVELDNTLLTIISERRNEQEQKQENYSRREFSFQSFQRSFELPAHVVDAEHIQAKYENGLLQLIIPKREEAKQRPPRIIQIL